MWHIRNTYVYTPHCDHSCMYVCDVLLHTLDGLIGLGVLGGAAVVGGALAVGAVALLGLGIAKAKK